MNKDTGGTAVRKILFRGKRETHLHEWVYGDFYRDMGAWCIIQADKDGENNTHFLVIPETVGQYAGLKDKNGKRIFEGDIVKLTHTLGKETGVIQWSEKECAFMLVKKTGCLMSLAHVSEFPECVEVIGNIHDNPELMGKRRPKWKKKS